MDKTHLYYLAYAFRNSKVWEQIYEEEIFAIKLPSKSKKTAGSGIAYCVVMGRNGEHMALAVYTGAEAFSSYRKLVDNSADHAPKNVAELLIQDCVQCSIEKRDQFDPLELDELKVYCKAARIPYRAPFPQFTRYYPHCVPWNVSKASDWNAIGAALDVVTILAMELKHSDKAALGLRPVAVGLHGEAYGTKQLDPFDDPTEKEVTIPLYSIVDGNLVIERVPLPPFTEAAPLPPTRFNDVAIAKLMRSKQEGTYQCEIIRLPEPVDGRPPYIPALLVIVDEEGFMLTPAMGKGPEYDPDRMLNEFISNLGDAYPKIIQVRTAETKVLLEEFCRRAKIQLVEAEDLDLLDEAVDSIMDHMGYDSKNEDEVESHIQDMIEMLRAMTEKDIRTIPDMILNDLLANADLFPVDVVEKLRKAKEKGAR